MTLASSSIALKLFPSRIFDFLYQNFVDVDLKWGKNVRGRDKQTERKTDGKRDGWTDEVIKGLDGQTDILTNEETLKCSAMERQREGGTER